MCFCFVSFMSSPCLIFTDSPSFCGCHREDGGQHKIPQWTDWHLNTTKNSTQDASSYRGMHWYEHFGRYDINTAVMADNRYLTTSISVKHGSAWPPLCVKQGGKVAPTWRAVAGFTVLSAGDEQSFPSPCSLLTRLFRRPWQVSWFGPLICGHCSFSLLLAG